MHLKLKIRLKQKIIFLNSAITLLSSKRKHDKSELEARWITLAAYATTNRQRDDIMKQAVKARAEWSESGLKYFTSSDHDERIKKRAQQDFELINKYFLG